MPDMVRPARRRMPALAAAALLLATLGAGPAACGDTPRGTSDSNGSAPPPQPPVSTPGPPTPPAGGAATTVRGTVVRIHPHDPDAFTQGMFFVGGRLFESTGMEGESDVREVDLATGAVKRKRELPAPYFGEGSVALNGRLYQLTWKHGQALVYDLATFTPRDTLTYYGEGWGLTTDGESLIMSDGSARLRVLDPATFAVRRTIDVRDGVSPVSKLNELEWVEGEILANVWESDQIVRIDPRSGAVTGWIDLTGLLTPADRASRVDVLNGIAYDAAAKRLYVTGKWWPKLFEIAWPPRP